MNMSKTLTKITKNQLTCVTLEIIFFAVVLLNFQLFVTSDFWFHLKLGEQISKTWQIPFTDIYSSSVNGKQVIPYEWLYEVIIYYINLGLGRFGVALFSLSFLMTYLLAFRQILVEILHLNLISRLVFLSAVVLITYPFWSERPQIVAYTCFLLTLYLILKRVFQQKNLLYLTIPLFLIWTNTHASIIIGVGLFSLYSIFSFVKYRLTNQNTDLKLFKDFLIFGIINLFVTILPPLGIRVYQLLFKFYKNKDLISSFLDEWYPLTSDLYLTTIYAIIFAICLSAFTFIFYKSKSRRNELLNFIPLLPFSFLVWTGSRHGTFSLPLILLFLIPFINSRKIKIRPVFQIISILAITCSTGILLNHFMTQNAAAYERDQRHYPTQAVPFMKDNLKGNMLSDIKLGGFIIYALGPEQKVVIDGRTEMYLPDVLSDFQGFSSHRYETEDSYYSFFNYFAEKYDVSWIFLSSENFTAWRKLMRILYYQPNWHLVYFDDSGIILARDDGKNTETIKQFGLSSVTPYQKNLFRDGVSEEQAMSDYQKMYNRSPSSVSANSIGFFLYKQKKLAEAKPFFENAIKLDKFSVSPKINLAEIFVSEKNPEEAIKLYQQALIEDPNRSTAYLRLGELYIQEGRPKEQALDLWQKGLKTDFLDDQTKQLLLNNINSTNRTFSK